MDRFLVFEEVMVKDIFVEVEILPCLVLDHWHVHLDLHLKEAPKNRPFHFESSWFQDPYFMIRLDLGGWESR